jgi:hypothetical protein
MYGRKGLAIRWQPKPVTVQAQPVPATGPLIAAPVPDVPDLFSLTLMEACAETLDRLRRTTKPIEKAQLARALRDLRETFHLATGRPRPGLLRDTGKPSRAPMPRGMPAGMPQSEPQANGSTPTG